MTMRRRTVLAAIGTTLATTGCLGAATPGTGEGDGATDSPTDSPTETPGTPDGPYPEYPDSIRNAECPSFADADRTVCNHTRSADADLYLSTSSAVYEPIQGNDAVETVTFTLHDESDQQFGFNPYGWTVKHRTDDGWQHVAPEVHPEPWTTIQPGQTYRWELSTQTHPTPKSENTNYPVVEDLKSGLHAFTIAGLLGDRDDEDPTEVECIALFAVAVRPTS